MMLAIFSTSIYSLRFNDQFNRKKLKFVRFFSSSMIYVFAHLLVLLFPQIFYIIIGISLNFSMIHGIHGLRSLEVL